MSPVAWYFTVRARVCVRVPVAVRNSHACSAVMSMRTRLFYRVFAPLQGPRQGCACLACGERVSRGHTRHTCGTHGGGPHTKRDAGGSRVRKDAAAECQRSFYACVAPPSVLVRERPCAVASVISLRFSARHTDAARPRGQQVGHALAPRHLLGVGRVELPKACRVNAHGRGDHRAATLVGPIRAPPSCPWGSGRPLAPPGGCTRRAARGTRGQGGGGGTAGVRPAAKNSRCSSLTSGRGRKSARARGRRR